MHPTSWKGYSANFAQTEFSEVHTGENIEHYRAYVNQAVVTQQSWREMQSRWLLLRMTDSPSCPTLEPGPNESREEMTVGYATTNPYTNEVVETFPDATDVELAA